MALKHANDELFQVLLAYAEMVQRDFLKYAEDEMLACILMNNVQQLRVQLEKMYEQVKETLQRVALSTNQLQMGGENLDEQTAETLNSLQTKLNAVLEKLANIFAQTQEKCISVSMVDLSKRLDSIKGQQVRRASLSQSELCTKVQLVSRCPKSKYLTRPITLSSRSWSCSTSV